MWRTSSILFSLSPHPHPHTQFMAEIQSSHLFTKWLGCNTFLPGKGSQSSLWNGTSLPTLLLSHFLGILQNNDLPLALTRFMLNMLVCCWSKRLYSSAEVLLAVLSTYSTNINYVVSYLSWKHCAGSFSVHICGGNGRSLGEGGGEDMNGWTFMKTMCNFGQKQVVLNFNHSCYLFCFSQKSCSFAAPGNLMHNKPMDCFKELWNLNSCKGRFPVLHGNQLAAVGLDHSYKGS